MKRILITLLLLFALVVPSFGAAYHVKQSTTAYPLVFFMVDSADHITGKTGLTVTVTLSKAGGAFAAASGAVSEIGNGWYKVAGNATDTNTLGALALHATATGADALDVLYEVVAFDPQSATNLGLSALPTANPAANGGLPTVNGSNHIVGIQSNGISAASIADGAIDANTFATDALGAAAWSSGATAEIADQVWDELRADHTAAGSFGQGVASVQGNITGSVATLTDKTGFRLSSTGVDDIWDEVQSGHTTAGTFGKYLDIASSTIVASGLTAGGIADAVWDEATAGHTTAGTFGEQAKTDIDAILDDTGTAGVVLANDAITAAKIAADSIGASELAADALGASEIATDAIGAAEIAADAIAASEIATDAIGAAEVAADAIGASEIASNAITANEIATDAIGSAEIDTTAVAEMANGNPASLWNSTITAVNTQTNFSTIDFSSAPLAGSALVGQLIAFYHEDYPTGPPSVRRIVSFAPTGSDGFITIDSAPDFSISTTTTFRIFPVGTQLETIRGKLPSKTYLTGSSNSDGDVQLDEATGSFASGAITATSIAADAIGASEIAADAIGASELATDAIGAAEIAADAIAASEIATDAIGAAELAANSITSSEIADNAVDAGALATDTITAAKIAADAIGASELAANSIGSSEIATDAATEIQSSAAIATGTISTISGTTVVLNTTAGIGGNAVYDGCIIVFEDTNDLGIKFARTVMTSWGESITISASIATGEINSGDTFWIYPGTSLDVATYNKLPSKSKLTGTANSDGDVQLDEATGSLASGAIASGSFASGAITATAIATDAIGAAEVAADAIGASEIAADAIAASEIAADAIGASEVATDAIGAAEVAASAIGTSELATGALTSDEVAASFLGTFFNVNTGIASSSAVSGSVIKETADSVAEFIETSEVSVSELAAGVWDSATTGHTGAGTFGAQLKTTLDTVNTTVGTNGVVLANDAITAAKIAADAIGASEVAADALGASELATDAIGANEIATDAIGANELATDAITGTDLGASAATEIAASVWDIATSGHTTAGTFGEQVKTNLDLNNTRTNTLYTDWIDGGRLDLILDARASQSTANTISTNVSSVKTVTDNLATAIELDGSFYRFTTNALEQAPGVAANLDAIADAVWDEARTGHTTAGTFGNYLDASVQSSGAGGASAIADAVWDEATSGHVSAGTFGAGVKLASGSITSSVISTDAIGASQIAADAIGASEIATDAIGAAEVAANAITSSEVAADAIGASEVADGAIDVGAFAADAITAAKVADGAIDAATLASGTITSAKFAAGAIDAAAIATDAIGAAEIAADAIDASGIAADAIGASELATDAVGANELATDAIGASEIAASAIGSAELADSAITANKIASNAITSAKLATDAIGAAQIAAGSIGTSEIATAVLGASFNTATDSLEALRDRMDISPAVGTAGGGTLTAKVGDSTLSPRKRLEVIGGEQKTITLITEANGRFNDATPTDITIKLKDSAGTTITKTNASVTRITEEADIQVDRITLTPSETNSLVAGYVIIELNFDGQKALLKTSLYINTGL